MPRVLIYDASKCTGCRYCEMACTLRHKGTFGTSGSMIKIVSNEERMRQVAMFCHQCKKPVCVDLCPVGAIIRSDETGLVSVDPGKCISCGQCVQCPLGGMDTDTDTGLAVNCDLCHGKPACVEFCPTGALQYVLKSEARRMKSATIQPI